MRRYVLIAGALIAFFLLLFVIVEALRVPLLADPTPWMNRGGALAACVGVGLLVADVLLPVPSIPVMVAHGALFGVWAGTLLSLAGGVGATLFGFAVGRRGGALLRRLVTDQERERADRLLRRWGALAIVVTRPVPLLAETVAIIAGTSPLGWASATLAAAVGSLPPALLYALAGAAAVNLRSVTLVFVLSMLAAALICVAGQWAEPRLARLVRRRL